MGKPTGFMEYDRKGNDTIAPGERIRDFHEFHTPLSVEERKCQGARCMDCGVPFCQSGMELGGMVSGCPLHNLIPEWNDLLFRGNEVQSYKRLRKTNNFPEFTSRVCPAPCEAACTCGLGGEPVTIRDNEYAITELAYAQGSCKPEPPKVRTGKRVAVIGSGPAGLAVADQLNHRGHEVTVYERSDRPGGLLMYGIPNMKLEKSIIERRLALMREEGVCFLNGVDINTEAKANKIKKEYDCVVLACGAGNPRDIKVPGREAEGIMFAVDYLKTVTKSLLDSDFADNAAGLAKGKNVVVIGGGDTGNDCVATAVRQGAKSVVQLEMMPKQPEERSADNPWPEWPRVAKTDYGQEEARAVYGEDPRCYQTTVTEFIKDKSGKLVRIKVVGLRPELDEASGRMVMLPVGGSERELPAELVLIAAGFLGASHETAKAFGVELNERTNVKTKQGSYMTNVKNVYVAGDMHRGQSLVVWAIKEGREAAWEIDCALMGYSGLPC